MKATASSTWGAAKETLAITYKGLMKSTLNYAAPIWAPNASSSSFLRLQKVQNAALRLATGCHAITPIQHLHQGMQEIPLEPHAHMLGAQFLAAASCPSHPSHHLASVPPGPRRMKETLSSKYGPVVRPFLSDGVIPAADVKKVSDKIHTNAVLKSIDDLGHNPVLGIRSPPIDNSECLLPRRQRCVLAQLRSGFSSHLRSNSHRIGAADDAICPECLVRRHTTRHLFECEARPTPLTVVDLWCRPVLVMEFLLSLPSFSSLIPPDPLLPPPPPPPSPDPPPPRPPPLPDPPTSPSSPGLFPSFSSSVSSYSSVRLLYSPPPSPCSSSSSSTPPKRVCEMVFD